MIFHENDRLMLQHVDPNKFQKKVRVTSSRVLTVQAEPIEEFRAMYGFTSPKVTIQKRTDSINEYPDLNRSIGNSITDTLYSVSPVKGPASTKPKKRNIFQNS
jgi:hypothetical protein